MISDAFILTICCIILFIYGAKVNEMFNVHINLMRENKKICIDLYRNREMFFDPTFKSNNYIYNQAVQFFSKRCNNCMINLHDRLESLI